MMMVFALAVGKSQSLNNSNMSFVLNSGCFMTA